MGRVGVETMILNVAARGTTRERDVVLGRLLASYALGILGLYLRDSNSRPREGRSIRVMIYLLTFWRYCFVGDLFCRSVGQEII